MTEKIPLVLLPAFMSTRALWEPQINALADIAEITVVELTPYDSVVKMADAVLDRAPERFALAGLSLGAFAAFDSPLRAPERIMRLALISTSAGADAPERLAARKKQIEAVRAGRFEEVVEGFLKVLQPSGQPWSPEVLESVRQMVHEAGQDCFFRQQDAMKIVSLRVKFSDRSHALPLSFMVETTNPGHLKMARKSHGLFLAHASR